VRYIFDFDGVLVDSNELKFMSFLQLERQYCKKPASEEFERYLLQNSALTRRQKIDALIEIHGSDRQMTHSNLLSSFAKILQQNYQLCDNCISVLNRCADWYICSAGDPLEIKTLLNRFGVSKGSGRVFGNLSSKIDVLTDIKSPSCSFFGDSYHDYLAAKSSKVDFYFCSYWATEVEKDKFEGMNVRTVKTVKSLREKVRDE
jgi:phosphoglycolate phosphatase-like HAD superfamily hydrolase